MTTEVLTVFEASDRDLQSVVALYEHLNPGEIAPEPERAAEVFRCFQTYKGSAIICGSLGSTLVTSCTLIVVPNLTRGGTPYGLIENVVTHRDYRGNGFGRAMLDAATTRAWQQDCYKLMLLTGSTLPGTLAFYQAAGFEQSKTGFQKRLLPKRAE